MTDAGVRRALGRLVDRTDSGVAPRHRATIDRARAAVPELDRAAAFVAAGGLTDLRRAVAAADRTGATTLAARGRRALLAFTRFRAAAAPAERSRSVDHFHPAGGTHKPPSGQREDR